MAAQRRKASHRWRSQVGRIIARRFYARLLRGHQHRDNQLIDNALNDDDGCCRS